MKKRIGLIVAIVVAALIICLLIWRFLPHSLSNAISVDENSIIGFSAYAMVSRFEDGQSYTDTYRIDNTDQQSHKPEKMIEILATSGYQQDFRNLLSWGIDSVASDKNYDGSTVTLSFYSENAETEYFEIQFLSSSIAVVTTEAHPSFRIYHPTNHKTMYDLIEYVKNYGIKQTS